ncbi:MAG TPA: septum site-determining protein MinC [Cerasibacillus sp.]|uniref:septum site-determining protein MinC n=1 Tax=Cerasibacillus sp. TaxID=2498711 RepID=UPI002F42772E
MKLEQKKQLITIKGTEEGLTIFMDDLCSFDELVVELEEKITTVKPKQGEPVISVKVQLGNRYLSHEHTEEIRNIIEKGDYFTVEMFDSAVIHKEEMEKWQENQDIKVYRRVVRSGQVLQVKGDVLLIGDVNPGGKVVSTGDVYVLGRLNGVAHAGVKGNKHAIIAASYMKPTQLRIANYISRAPDYESDGVYMECGFIDSEQDKIMIDRLQQLTRQRRDLKELERRMQNG